MAEPEFREFSAKGVRIDRSLRSLTRAGQVKIRDGRLELLTSYGAEIDSAPVDSVEARRPWFGGRDRARATATVNGTRYVLALGEDGSTDPQEELRRFLDAVRAAREAGPH
ncbi:hypothetical protein I5Q34_23185 [Streptomyces sp. AV19]|uniref:hypothetical protein n=1 Tax=Streptomyces sp. AV19 TaxID=2793068 RepID=UPI0018FE9F39|nr:hypothetical protein [Streptomyces sp. AV19]MBH1937137.1 hypothetical protein [Streptomyces sp. AV19]MDG4533164.1 hypothetical protein [Streptomyces sp. AV19]